ncbi:hypothetical protein C5S36_07970 [Candidatus Methanophagaceae archaeon]|nr:hypothetical protein C5S36_07970 [Methanophagales archaeon]
MKTYTFLYVYTLFECMAKEKRKTGQRSRTGETKGEIIKYALEHGGMFEGSVLKDFLEENCNVRRDTTKKHLYDLNKKGIFETTGEKGYTSTWRIVEDTKAIVNIYKEYPHLLRYLQQSDFILDYIAKKQDLLFEDNAAFEVLKKMMSLSPKMFELCLTVDNLGRKFLMVSSKIDYYGISEIAFEKMLSGDKKNSYYDFLKNVVFDVDGPYTSGKSSESGEKSDYDPTVKHYIRWELFRSCLKTDISFLDVERISEEIEEMIEKENATRAAADAAVKTRDAKTFREIAYLINRRYDAIRTISFYEELEELAEVMKNPEKYPEKIKELNKIAREGEELSGRYFFSWDSIPGNDNERLLRYLRDCIGIDWADDDAKIRKSDDVKTIYISKDENSVEILIDEENEKATLTLKISNGITHELNHELKVKNENGKLNIYTYTPEL